MKPEGLCISSKLLMYKLVASRCARCFWLLRSRPRRNIRDNIRPAAAASILRGNTRPGSTRRDNTRPDKGPMGGSGIPVPWKGRKSKDKKAAGSESANVFRRGTNRFE